MENNINEIVCKDSDGKSVRLGDKIRGVGLIQFSPGNYEVDLTPVVTVNRGENGRIYFGQLSKESFRNGFYKVNEKITK